MVTVYAAGDEEGEWRRVSHAVTQGEVEGSDQFEHTGVSEEWAAAEAGCSDCDEGGWEGEGWEEEVSRFCVCKYRGRASCHLLLYTQSSFSFGLSLGLPDGERGRGVPTETTS